MATSPELSSTQKAVFEELRAKRAYKKKAALLNAKEAAKLSASNPRADYIVKSVLDDIRESAATGMFETEFYYERDLVEVPEVRTRLEAMGYTFREEESDSLPYWMHRPFIKENRCHRIRKFLRGLFCPYTKRTTLMISW